MAVELHNVGKLVFLLVALVGAFAAAISSGDFESVDQFISGIVLYALGDGVSAARKRAPSPIITPALPAGELATTTGSVQVSSEALHAAAAVVDAVAKDAAHDPRHTGQTPPVPGGDDNDDFWRGHGPTRQ